MPTIDAVYERRSGNRRDVLDARDEMQRAWCAEIVGEGDEDGLGCNLARAEAVSAGSNHCG